MMPSAARPALRWINAASPGADQPAASLDA
jgi:hypothetical protein